MWGTRHSLALLAFLGLSLVYAMRVNLSVAIVAMVRAPVTNSTATVDNATQQPEIYACELPDGYDDSAQTGVSDTFVWEKHRSLPACLS